MTSEDLKKFRITIQWRNARIKFCEEQKETINRLGAILSDMPKGSRQVYDSEAESLTKLIDQINELEAEVRNETMKTETKIKEQLENLEPKYGLLLYHHYILGNSIKYIAKEVLHYREKYVYDLKKEALNLFDKCSGKKRLNQENKM